MKAQTFIGPWARELIRFGFSALAVWLFYTQGNKHACDSTVMGVKTNADQIFALIILLVIGLGSGLIMKAIELKIKKP